MTKSKRERLEEKMEQLKAQLQAEKAKEKARERKERTKRLIEVGSVFESYFGELSKEDAVKVAKYLSKQVRDNKKSWKNMQLSNDERGKHKLDQIG